MRIVYPLLWARLNREASSEQAVSTAAALARRGIDMTLLMPQGPADPPLTAADLRAYYGVEGDLRLVQRTSRWSGNALLPSLIWARRVFRDPRAASADLLYSRIPVMLTIGGGSPVPFAGDYYRPWPDQLPIAPLVRRTARHPRCLGLILHSHYAAQSYRRAGVPEDRLLVAHNGTEPRWMGSPLDRKSARLLLGLPNDRPIVVYAGRIGRDKGLDQVAALAALRPEILFLLVGGQGEAGEEEAVSRSDNIRLVPWQTPDALARWLWAADVLLVPPSRKPLERFGNCVVPMKLLAYLGAGRPILAPALPDVEELLEHDDNALLVPPDDPAAAAAALDRLLGEQGLADRLAAQALRLSLSLSWDSRAEKIAVFLERRLRAAAD
jgi:glycosyltransferase involved in cell wall biosynthesis